MPSMCSGRSRSVYRVKLVWAPLYEEKTKKERQGHELQAEKEDQRQGDANESLWPNCERARAEKRSFSSRGVEHRQLAAEIGGTPQYTGSARSADGHVWGDDAKIQQRATRQTPTCDPPDRHARGHTLALVIPPSPFGLFTSHVRRRVQAHRNAEDKAQHKARAAGHAANHAIGLLQAVRHRDRRSPSSHGRSSRPLATTSAPHRARTAPAPTHALPRSWT